jgi:hypothetical protein
VVQDAEVGAGSIQAMASSGGRGRRGGGAPWPRGRATQRVGASSPRAGGAPGRAPPRSRELACFQWKQFLLR